MKNVQIAIIGSGFGGLGSAIRLKQEGIADFIIFERADDVGGVWRDNTYPGCACDVQSHLYSPSFVPNPDWTRSFSTQAEIWDYLRRCARDYGVLPHIRFGHSVNEAHCLPLTAHCLLLTAHCPVSSWKISRED